MDQTLARCNARPCVGIGSNWKSNRILIHRSRNMVFTQGRGFVLGASFGLQISFAPLSRFGSPRRGHRLLGTYGSFTTAEETKGCNGKP